MHPVATIAQTLDAAEAAARNADADNPESPSAFAADWLRAGCRATLHCTASPLTPPQKRSDWSADTPPLLSARR